MTKTYGILAYPAKHSLSPVMHNAAFKSCGIDAQYGVFEISENGLDVFFKQVKDDPIYGLSVSLPYKEVVSKYMNVVDEDARAIGAINTVANRGGILYGYNTDCVGCVAAIKEIMPSLKDKRVVVIGAGGASRAIIYGLLKEKAKVYVFNRHKDKAEKLKEDFSKFFKEKIIAGDLVEMLSIGKSDLLIHATSTWISNPNMSIEEVENFLPIRFVEKFDVVMDIVYKPLITPLLKMARDLKKQFITGEKMLLHQAADQFKIWTGQKAPIDIMRKALEDNVI